MVKRAAPPGAPVWSATWAAVGVALTAVLIAFMCARPVADSDLWFHMAYARQMLERGTPILDHTVFSWSPSDNAIIYCAWLTQLGLHGLYQLGGLTALFVARYVVFGAVLAVVTVHAHRHGALRHPLTWFATIVAMLMSSSAVNIKPNLASYLFMTVIVALWSHVRRVGANAQRWAYALPAVMVLWVNSHGGFVIGLAFLALALLGECLNVLVSPRTALPPPLRRHVIRAVVLCFGAVFVTPYLWRYPLQFFTVEMRAVDLLAVREYDSIFASSQRGLHYVEYGAAMALVLSLAFVRRASRDVEWGLLLTTLVFGGLYAYYARLTSFWAPIALMSAITLLGSGARLTPRSTAGGRWMGSAVLATGVALGGHATWNAALRPPVGVWQGFGNGYWNPEEEADYIARHFAGARLGNDYNAGSYLLWRLWPKTKVFIDARHFPYLSWFQEYLRLESTDGIEAFVEKQQAELWCIEHVLPRTVAWFRSSPDWEPAYYASSAVVFVKRGATLPGGRLQSGSRLGDIRNLYQALLVFGFALDVADLAGAEAVVKGMERRFTHQDARPLVADARAVLDGVLAHRHGDYDKAVRLLARGTASFQGVPSALLVESALLETRRLWQADDVPGALAMARTAAGLAPRAAIARYNAGVVGWWRQRRTPQDRDDSWRADLEAFLALPRSSDPLLTAALETARSLLEGRPTGRPAVLAPPDPRAIGGRP